MDRAEPVLLTSAPLKGDDRAQALALVDEVQETRQARLLKPHEVPHVLYPYQARWHEDRAAIRLAVKSRRIGWSWGAMASEAVLEASLKRTAGGMNQFYMGFNQAMSAEFIGDCAFFAKAFGTAISAIDVWRDVMLIENERRDILRYKIHFASGHRIEALSSNPYSWRGKQGHARIDEAAFHENLREVIKGALAFRMLGGRIDIVSTHNTENNYFAELVRDIEAGHLPWSLHKVDFDEALRQGFYKRRCLIEGKTWSPEAERKYRDEVRADYPDAEDAAEELDCIPRRGSGAYFTRMIIEPCFDDSCPVITYSRPSEFVLDEARLAKTQAWLNEVLKPVLDALPTDKRCAFGQDFGRSGDLSSIWVLQDDGSRWRTAMLVELRNIPFDVQQQITFFILKTLPLLQGAKFDSRGNGQAHAEAALQKFGPAFVECVMLSAGWYAENFPKYRAAYENREILVPRSEDIVQDHRLVVLRDGNPAISAARVKGSDGKDRHGDSAVAGVLAWAAACGDGTPPPAGETVDTPAGTYDPSTAERGHRLLPRPPSIDRRALR